MKIKQYLWPFSSHLQNNSNFDLLRGRSFKKRNGKIDDPKSVERLTFDVKVCSFKFVLNNDLWYEYDMVWTECNSCNSWGELLTWSLRGVFCGWNFENFTRTSFCTFTVSRLNECWFQTQSVHNPSMLFLAQFQKFGDLKVTSPYHGNPLVVKTKHFFQEIHPHIFLLGR